MRLKCLGCEALARLIYTCAARSPHLVDVSLFQLGLHLKPADLRQRLQAEIDAASQQDYDSILLVYGLCGRATEGLVARQIPVIIPRAHDCITLFLGDRQLYKQQQALCPGTYWYALDYIERGKLAGNEFAALGADSDIQPVYEEYVAKYGKDNADYLMEVMGAWKSHYQRAVYLEMGVGDGREVEARAQAEALRRGWTFEKMAGDLRLLQRLFDGDWEKDFLVLKPGQGVSMSLDDDVIYSVDNDHNSA
jgi:hypothetical protein